MACIGVADIGNGDVEGARHGVEFILVPREILVCPGVGIAVAGNANAVEITRCEGSGQDHVGVFAVRRGVEPMYGAIPAPGRCGHGIARDKMEQGIDTEKRISWLEDVDGLADVIAVFRRETLVDFEDDVVVVGVL